METGESANIEKLRAQIGKLGLDILRLINERTSIALEIVAEKARVGLPVRDPQREDEILEKLRTANDGPLDSDTVEIVFRALFDATVAQAQQGAGDGTPPHDDSRRDGGPGPGPGRRGTRGAGSS